MCFADADWLLIGGSFTVQGVSVMWPKKPKAMLTEAGPLDADRIADLQWQLHEAFPRQKEPNAKQPSLDWTPRTVEPDHVPLT